MSEAYTFKCERCGATAAGPPWPNGWHTCGRSRYVGTDGAAWCPPCGLLMPAGNLDLFQIFGVTADWRTEQTERIVFPPRLPDYTEADVLIVRKAAK